MSAAYYPQVQKIYVAYYGRPADPAGLQYWAGQLAANGGSLTAIINAFGNSAESTALYAGADNAAKVTAIYQQLFNRSPDSAGLAFYVNELSLGRMTAASIALNVANGATGTDATYLTNKQAVASSFTDSLTTDSAAAVAYAGTTAANTARALISGVTTSAATTNVASTIAAIKPGGGAAATGQTFTLTFGPDVITGTARSDVITAAKNTFTAIDLIADNSTTDSDTLNVTYDTTDVTNNAKVGVINIENVNVNYDTIADGKYDAGSTFGATITVGSPRATFSGNATVSTAAANNVTAGKGLTGTLTITGLAGGIVNAGSAAGLNITADDTNKAGGIEIVVNGDVALTGDFDAAADNTSNTLAITATKASTVTLTTDDVLTKVVGTGAAVTLATDVADITSASVSGANVKLTSAAALNVTNFAASTQVDIATAGAMAITNVNGQAFTLSADETAALSFDNKTDNVSTMSLVIAKNQTGGSIELKSGFASAAVSVTGKSWTLPDFKYTGVTTLSIAGDTTITELADSAATDSITVTGSGNLTVATGTTDDVAIMDASGISGGLTLSATAQAQTITGGAGNDTITSANTTTKSTISTGGGNDSVTFSAKVAGATVSVTTGDGNDTVDFADADGLDTTSNITVSLGAGDDTLKLGSGAGGALDASADQKFNFDGGDGTDTLDLGITAGELGTTALTTGAITISNFEALKVTGTANVESSLLSGKTYTINGGTGASDHLTVKFLATTKSVDLSGLTISSNLEKVVTDVSAQTEAVNIVGSGGIDEIKLTGFTDTINGGAGNDVITMDDAGASSTVSGGAGNDTFVFIGNTTATDKITFTGGAGTDTIDLSDLSLAGTPDANTFTFTDFTAGAGGDVIKIKENAAGTLFGVTSASYDKGDTVTVQNAATTVALTTNAAGVGTVSYVIYDTAAAILSSTLDAAATGFLAIASDTGAVYFDADGNFTTGAVKIGTITITGTLTSDNFVIV